MKNKNNINNIKNNIKNKTKTALFLAFLLLLSACGQGGNHTPEPAQNQNNNTENNHENNAPISLTACVGDALDTLDPAHSTAWGGETVLYHIYENLMRWEDGGQGRAVPAPGQAESYTVETDYAGNASYTFTLRRDAAWSDGQPVTAADFVTAWRRLANPASQLPHRELMACIAGYDEVRETGDASLLSVSAPDEHTFRVTLNGGGAYFLEEVCASAYTTPVREDLLDNGGWGSGANAVTNGAYTVAGWTDELVRLERSGTYYNPGAAGPDELRFVSAGTPELDYRQFLDGTVDFSVNLPDNAFIELSENGGWIPEPVTTVYGVQLNTAEPPFDSPEVRLAFRLAVDTAAVTDALGSLIARPAVGFIPYGISDYSQRPPAEDLETGTGAESEPELNSPWDFRAHSLERVTMPSEGSYEENCRQAKTLLAQAGYPGGNGFPTVEYLYVKSVQNDAAARALRQMWQTALGVPMILNGVSREEILFPEKATETSESTEASEPEKPETAFYMAARDFAAPYHDAAALLEYWRGGNPDNPDGYQSGALDILLDTARSAASPDVRDALLHDAEAVLLTDAPVIPVYYYGGGFLLNEQWAGLYRKPDGVYFLFNIYRGN